MAIVARNPKTPRWHVIITDQKDVPDDKKFAFEYVMLDLDREANLRDNIISVRGMGDDRQEKFSLGKQDVEILKTCVRNWRNFLDEDDGDTPFNIDKLDHIHPRVREEMVRVIKGETPLSAARKKELEENLS